MEFLAGSRAIHFAIASLERDKVITKLLGCNPEAFPERIETLQVCLMSEFIITNSRAKCLS